MTRLLLKLQCCLDAFFGVMLLAVSLSCTLARAEEAHDNTACGRIPKMRALETQYRNTIEAKIAQFEYAKHDEAVAELIEFSQRMLSQTAQKSQGNIEYAAQLAVRESCARVEQDLDRIVSDQQKLWEAQVQLVSHFASVVADQLPPVPKP